MTMSPFCVRVPASTSNLGSGFDTVSAALGLYLSLWVEATGGKDVEWVQGEKPESIFPTGDNLIPQSIDATLAFLGCAVPGVRIRMHNPIPLQRGLGSSAAAIIGGIKIVEVLCGRKLEPEEVFRVAYPLEGHPDNLAASLLGGWVLSRVDGDLMKAERITSNLDCQFVLSIPNLSVSTREARAILPQRYSLTDATYNLQRCALLVHALHSDQTNLLREATLDRLHQPYRSQLVPGIELLLDRKHLGPELEEPLLAISISGSGSAVIALAAGHCEAIGQWMVDTLSRRGTSARFIVLDLDGQGARIREGG